MKSGIAFPSSQVLATYIVGVYTIEVPVMYLAGTYNLPLRIKHHSGLRMALLWRMVLEVFVHNHLILC